jgi:hypothetical protein
MKRRDPRIWQLAFAASKQAIDSAGVSPRSIVCGTALGALDETKNYLDGVFKDGFGSPRSFIASVHNSMAGRMAMEFRIRGPNITVCDGHNSFASALGTAQLLDGSAFPSLVLAVDENLALLRQLQPHLSTQCKEFLREGWQEAAVAFMIDTPSASRAAPCFCCAGPCLARGETPDNLCRRLTRENGFKESALLPLAESCDSFIKPAVTAYRLLTEHAGGETVIGSYSPSSDAAAVVSLQKPVSR